jgi:hypothetical protein
MKKGVLIFSSVLFILPLLFVISSESKAQVLEEKMVVIKGTDDWKNTKIKLFPKDKVIIKVTGKVCFSDGNNLSCVNANGMKRDTYDLNWEFDSQYCNDPMMDENHAALIGNVGSDDFIIGKNANFSGKDGVLYLGINDCTFTGNFYNTGQFEVFIKVTHIK